MKTTALFLLVVTISLIWYVQPPNYPRYTLVRTYCVPDSSKSKQREWIKETIRASNQDLTGRNIDETIQRLEHTSNNLFEVNVFALRKEIDGDPSNNVVLKPDELTNYEKRLLEKLIGVK